jgi:uncharacterized repeat protein (TIGR01451 family)
MRSSQYLSTSNVESIITMYKFLIASISAVGLIAATSLTQQFPLPAQAQTTPSTATQPAAKRVVLLLKAEKKVMEGTKVTYQSTSGKSVKPGDVLRYTVTAKNGDRPVKNLILTQPIPRGTSYVKNSANTLNGADLVFSVDGGKTYVAKPMEGKKEAPASKYTNLRWKFTNLMAAKAQVNATYEVTVK